MTRRSDGHVAWRDLVDRRDGVLAGPRRVAAEAHIASGCAECAAESAVIERLVGAIASGSLARPPRHAEELAIRAFRDVQSAFTDAADRVMGVLLLDGADEFEASLRSETAGARRLLWRVGEYELDADLVGRAGGADLLGQFLPGGDDPGARVTGVVAVRGPAGRSVRTRVEPDGRFTLRHLTPGLHVIEGRVDSMSFALPPVRVE